MANTSITKIILEEVHNQDKEMGNDEIIKKNRKVMKLTAAIGIPLLIAGGFIVVKNRKGIIDFAKKYKNKSTDFVIDKWNKLTNSNILNKGKNAVATTIADVINMTRGKIIK